MDLDVPAYEAVLDAVGDVADDAAFEDDAVLDLRVADLGASADRRERPYIRMNDPGVGANDHRTPDDRALDHRAGFDDDFAFDARLGVDTSIDAPDDRVENQSVRLEHVLELARVLPPAVDEMRPHLETPIDEVLDRVGDLQLVPEARLDALDRVEHRRREHVNADQREIALRLLRFLDQPHDAAVAKFRDAEHLRIADTREQDLRGGRARDELVDESVDAFVQEIVSKVHHERLGADERLADQDGMRQAARRVLLDVGDPYVPPRSVAHRRTNLRLRIAHHHPDLADAGRGQRFDPVEQHRLVRDRHELLGARVGQRPEASALAAAENQPFHRVWPPNAPNRFEKEPIPASVKERLNR